jgi:hypothetical protein
MQAAATEPVAGPVLPAFLHAPMRVLLSAVCSSSFSKGIVVVAAELARTRNSSTDLTRPPLHNRYVERICRRFLSGAGSWCAAMPRKQKLSEGDKAIVAKAGVDNTARRTWDKEEFAAKAAAQEKKVRKCVTWTREQMHGSSCSLIRSRRGDCRMRRTKRVHLMRRSGAD